MGVRTITNGEEAAIYCSTTGTAFGPIFTLPESAESKYDDLAAYVDGFLEWLDADARLINRKGELETKAIEFEKHVARLFKCDDCSDLFSWVDVSRSKETVGDSVIEWTICRGCDEDRKKDAREAKELGV